MSVKGVIFDFNGTLLWDTWAHNLAWDRFLAEHHLALSDQEKHAGLHGRTNKEILSWLFTPKPNEGQIASFALRKERLYQQICLESGMEFAPGAKDFVAWLKAAGAPYAIATASGIDNVTFYLERLDLAALCPPSHIVYNDGSVPGKPDPALFLKAIELLDLAPEEVVIFEDSASGIAAAERSGAGKVIIVDSNGDDYRRWSHQVIRDFAEVDRKLFRP